MTFRLSNNLVGVLNFMTFLFSIPILWSGIWLRNKGTSECEKFLDTPLIIIGAFLLVVSLAGVIGACFGLSWILRVYLVVMFVLIVLLFCFTVFTVVVTKKGAGEVIPGKGFKEYRLLDYSNWLRNRVESEKNWKKIKSCLVDGKLCSLFDEMYLNYTVVQFYLAPLNALQSGCCKPPDSCGYTYVGPTNWTKTIAKCNDTDCGLWDNRPDVLCFNCNSCKAGLLDNIKQDWKQLAVVKVIFLVALVVVYSLGCCALRNNRRDESHGWKP